MAEMSDRQTGCLIHLELFFYQAAMDDPALSNLSSCRQVFKASRRLSISISKGNFFKNIYFRSCVVVVPTIIYAFHP